MVNPLSDKMVLLDESGSTASFKSLKTEKETLKYLLISFEAFVD